MTTFDELAAHDSVRDCMRAIAIGQEALMRRKTADDDYRLIVVEQRLRGADAAPGRWLLRFKAARGIPASAQEEVAAGGEISVRVDLRHPDQAPIITEED